MISYSNNLFNRKESFHNIKSWLEEVKENSNPNTIIVLMGNQADRIAE